MDTLAFIHAQGTIVQDTIWIILGVDVVISRRCDVDSWCPWAVLVNLVVLAVVRIGLQALEKGISRIPVGWEVNSSEL
jgi:hypothetical protein